MDRAFEKGSSALRREICAEVRNIYTIPTAGNIYRTASKWKGRRRSEGTSPCPLSALFVLGSRPHVAKRVFRPGPGPVRCGAGRVRQRR